MQKKLKKILVVALALVCVSIIPFFGMACKKDGDTVSGGADVVESYVWSGLTNFNLKITDSTYDYDEVVVYDSDGLQYEVTVDDSAVQYGVQGEYVVKFTVGKESKEQLVKVYGNPTLSVGTINSFTYAQVMDKSSVDGLFANATATDCFGKVIPVGVEESSSSNSLYKQDGSVDYGQYTVVLCAIDDAGQTAREEVTFTVERDESAEPEITDGDFSVDVIDVSKEVGVSLKDYEIITISINGESVSQQFSINEYGTIALLNLSEIEALELGNSNILRLTTAGGYSEIVITLTDEADAVMDVSGRDNQIVIVGDKPAIVQPKKVYEKQNFEIELSMVDPNGEEIDTTEQTFDADEMGVYVLTATAKRDGVDCGSVTVKYNVHESFNSFRTEQDYADVTAYKSVYWGDGSQTGTRAYNVNKTLGEKTGNFLSFDFAGASYLGFNIPTNKTVSEIEAIRDLGVENVFVNVFIESKQAKSMRYSIIKKGALDDDVTSSDEGFGTPVKIQANTWTKLTVDINDVIDNYEALQSGEMVFFNIYNGGDGLDVHENFKIYFDEMLFELPPASLAIGADEYNSFANSRYLKGAKVYRNIDTNDPQNNGVTLSWVSEEVGGVVGNYAKVNIDIYYSGANGLAPSRVGVNFPIMKTLEEIQALKDGGYTHLSVPMYIDCTADKKIMGQIFTVGANSTSVSWMTLPAKTWTTFDIAIDDIIANYAGLAEGTKILLPIVNTGDGGETNQARFNVYYGAMKFVAIEAGPEEISTTYNECLSVEGATPTSGKADVAVGTSIGGVDGNYIRFRIWGSYVSLCIPTTQSLNQIKALKDNGYNINF